MEHERRVTNSVHKKYKELECPKEKFSALEMPSCLGEIKNENYSNQFLLSLPQIAEFSQFFNIININRLLCRIITKLWKIKCLHNYHLLRYQ